MATTTEYLEYAARKVAHTNTENENARMRLTEAVTARADLEALSRHLMDVAATQGKAEAWAWVALLDGGMTATNLRKHLTATLVRGANDNWGGYGNDVRRAAFNATREAIGEILGDLDRLDSTDDRCATCHRDAHRPGMPTANHGHAYVAPRA